MLSLVALCKGDGYHPWGNGLVMGHGSRTAVGSKAWRPDGHRACCYFELCDGALGGSCPFPHGPVRHPPQLEAMRRSRQAGAQGCVPGRFEAEVKVEDSVSPPCASSSHPTSPQPVSPVLLLTAGLSALPVPCSALSLLLVHEEEQRYLQFWGATWKRQLP